MCVQAEPKSMDPKDIARAILEPHGLTVRPEPRGTLLVVALPRKAPPVSRRPPGAAAGTPQGKPADRQRGAIEAGDPGGAVLCSSRQAGVSSLGRAHARPFSCSAVSNQPGADF
jgi:hypothetical protein